MHSGVRQGGILSPLLYAFYVNDVLLVLEKSNLGCRIKNKLFNVIMYADDILLLSISYRHLQLLVDICVAELSKLGMLFNCRKTQCIRVGPHFKSTGSNLVIGNTAINWGNNVKYLGIDFLTGARFNFNLQPLRQKFFGAVNSILSVTATKGPLPTVAFLIESHCTPILLYACEALDWSPKYVRKLKRCFFQVYYKLLNSFDTDLVNHTLYFLRALPLHAILVTRQYNYALGLRNPSHPCYLINAFVYNSTFTKIITNYSLNLNTLPGIFEFKQLVWGDYFKDYPTHF